MSSNQSFNVIEHDVAFYNSKDRITLSGTLSIPESQKKPAVVILVAGMGPYDRDYTQGNHKLFLTMKNYFTHRGIAVLRYDKRGVGKSGGHFDKASIDDLVQDVVAGVNFLKHERLDIDTEKIGLVGHSEGGLISFMVASKLSTIAFIVSMAGAVMTNVDDVVLSHGLQLKASGATDEFITIDKVIRRQIFEIITTFSPEIAHNKLLKLTKTHVDNLTDEQKVLSEKLFPLAISERNYEQIIAIANSAWRNFFSVNPTEFLNKVTVPVLAINGELDFIIYSKIALPIIEQGLQEACNDDTTVITMPDQNHCFQACSTGSLSEYSTIKETISILTLQLITDWIISKVTI